MCAKYSKEILKDGSKLHRYETILVSNDKENWEERLFIRFNYGTFKTFPSVYSNTWSEDEWLYARKQYKVIDGMRDYGKYNDDLDDIDDVLSGYYEEAKNLLNNCFNSLLDRVKGYHEELEKCKKEIVRLKNDIENYGLEREEVKEGLDEIIKKTRDVASNELPDVAIISVLERAGYSLSPGSTILTKVRDYMTENGMESKYDKHTIKCIHMNLDFYQDRIEVKGIPKIELETGEIVDEGYITFNDLR